MPPWNLGFNIKKTKYLGAGSEGGGDLILDKEIIKCWINLDTLDLKKVENMKIMEKINKESTS